MKLTLESRIRQRAYFLWLSGGGAGDETHFWLIAEREVLVEVAMESAAAFELAEATQLAEAAKPSPGSAAHRLARRVNALVLLDSGSNCEQVAYVFAAG
jgi:hypothetical protein